MAIANYIISYNSIAQPMVLVDPATGNSYSAVGGTGAAANQTQGATADGVSATGTNPVQIGGVDGGGLVQAIFTDSSGNLSVVGNVASGAADSGNPIKIGGVYNTAPPTLTNGQRGNIQLGATGAVTTQLTLPNAGASGSVAAGADAQSNIFPAYLFQSMGMVYNGTTWDRAYGNTNGQFAQGNVAPANADTGNPVKIGGRYNAALPAYSDGQRGDAQLDLSGNLRVRLVGTVYAGVDGQSNALATLTTSVSQTAQALMGTANYNFNGTTWDRLRKPNIFKRVASSAASGNPDFLKASAGDTYQFWGQAAATAVFLQLYNKASAPTIGTDTPVLTYPIAASSLFSQTIPNGGAYFSTGIAFAFTTDAAGTTGSAAAAVTAFALLGA